MTVVKPIFLLGEALGENELKTGTPFVGAAGVELLRMLDEARCIELTTTDRSYISRYFQYGDPHQIDMIWKLHPEVYRTNVFNLHPPRNDLAEFCGPKAEALRGWPALVKGKGFIRDEFSTQLDRLGDEIIQHDPNVIVCLGNTALWALTGQTGVSKLRGTTTLSTHCVAGYKLLPTYHPAAVLRQWENRPVALMDLMKAERQSHFPEVRKPRCEIWIEPNLEDCEQFYELYIRSAPLLSVDIETSGTQITCIGFAPSIDRSLVIPFYDPRQPGRSYWASPQLEALVWKFVARVLEDRSIPKLFQNGLYDIAFLWRANGIRTLGAREDSMLAHHALQPESLKGLAFLGSVYTDHSAWKSERKGTATIKRDE